MTAERILEHYDTHLFNAVVDEFYGDTGFANYGYWESGIETPSQASANLVEKLLALLADASGTILDVACGKGGTTSQLLKHYSPQQITAINISQQQLDAARQRAPGCTFRTMDAAKLDFPDASFDNLICVEAAFHFQTREDFFNEALRVLKPGGRLVLSDVLMVPGAEQRRLTFQEENYLPNFEAYDALARRVGFADVKLIDVTEACWQGFFWSVVKFAHQKLLDGVFSGDQLKTCLARTYDKVPELECYFVACLTKAK